MTEDGAKILYKFIIGIVICVAVIGFCIWGFLPVKYTAVVKGFRWEYEATTYEYQYCYENDWELPEGAELVETKSEIHHHITQLIPVGKTRVVNQIPIYATKYYIYKWIPGESYFTGDMTKTPYWYELHLPAEIQDPEISDVIEGPRIETYYVVLEYSDGKQKEIEVTREVWDNLEVGDTITYKSARLTGTDKIDELTIGGETINADGKSL